MDVLYALFSSQLAGISILGLHRCYWYSYDACIFMKTASLCRPERHWSIPSLLDSRKLLFCREESDTQFPYHFWLIVAKDRLSLLPHVHNPLCPLILTQTPWQQVLLLHFKCFRFKQEKNRSLYNSPHINCIELIGVRWWLVRMCWEERENFREQWRIQFCWLKVVPVLN